MDAELEQRLIALAVVLGLMLVKGFRQDVGNVRGHRIVKFVTSR